MLREQAIEKVDQLIPLMPPFVAEFVELKTADEYSPNTILEYLKNYQQFFQWLIDQQHVPEINISNISIESIENLSLRVATQYKSYLLRRKKQNSKKINEDGSLKESSSTLSKVTIQRNITALKVLFKFLSESANNKTNKPYLTHNIMNEISNVTDRQTLQARADLLEDKLFLDDETDNYLTFIRDIYPTTLSKQAAKYYNRDCERDLAINALMLASGLRLSEVVSLDVKDLNFDQNRVLVVRKGDKTDSVRIAAFAMEYLAKYLSIRDSRYQPGKYETALFLSISKGSSKRITGSAIEKMVEKYSSQFRVRVTPHKLRHTLATRLYQQTGNLVLTAQQLGHSSTTTTTLYVHIDNNKTTDALNSL
ncbi:tyrosine recombinase XerS [Enterococcus thailandicus]|uniref:tyrosine recombinase XerS n=1 Tax=Enterococcus thailandicus TaxID=417368 RepID=UPI0035D6F9D6